MSTFKVLVDAIEAEARLTKAEIELLLQSLDYTRRTIEQYTYPTIDLRRQRLDEVDTLRGKLLSHKRELKGKQ